MVSQDFLGLLILVLLQQTKHYKTPVGVKIHGLWVRRRLSIDKRVVNEDRYGPLLSCDKLDDPSIHLSRANTSSVTVVKGKNLYGYSQTTSKVSKLTLGMLT